MGRASITGHALVEDAKGFRILLEVGEKTHSGCLDDCGLASSYRMENVAPTLPVPGLSAHDCRGAHGCRNIRTQVLTKSSQTKTLGVILSEDSNTRQEAH